jgi:hypothetical protein
MQLNVRAIAAIKLVTYSDGLLSAIAHPTSYRDKNLKLLIVKLCRKQLKKGAIALTQLSL